MSAGRVCAIAICCLVGVSCINNSSAQATAQPAATAPTVHHVITLGQWQNKPALLIDIQAPAELDAVNFIDRQPRLHSAQRKNTLVPRDECVKVEPEQVVRVRSDPAKSGQTACDGTMRLALQSTTAFAQAMYSISRPMSAGGVLWFPQYVLTYADGMGMSWRVTAPVGMHLLAQAQAYEPPTSWERTFSAATVKAVIEGLNKPFSDGYKPLGVDAYAYIGPQKPQPIGQMQVLRDASVPDLLYQELMQTGKVTLEVLNKGVGYGIGRTVLLGMAVDPPSDQQDQPQSMNMKGDVDPQGNVMLAFSRADAIPSAQDIQRWRELVAHEFVHLYNGGSAQLRTDHSNPWLHEGGADFLLLATLQEANMISSQRVVDRLNTALQQCLSNAEGLHWAKDSQRWMGQKPYHCGSMFYLLAWQSVRSRDPKAKILPTWGQYWRGGEQSVQTFIKHFQVNELSSLFDAPALGPSLRKALEQRGYKLRHNQSPSANLVASTGTNLFRDLASADCKSWGFWPVGQDYIQLDHQDFTCTTLKGGERIQTIEGLSILKSPLAAAQAAHKACAERKAVRIGRTDATSFDLACKSEQVPVLPDAFYEFEHAPLLSILGMTAK